MREIFELTGLTSDERDIVVMSAIDDVEYAEEENIYVCDPSYLFSREDWSRIMDIFFSDDGKKILLHQWGTLLIKGCRILYTETAHGEGAYDVNYDNKHYGMANCDSGMLCVLSENDLERLKMFLEEPQNELFVKVPNFKGIVHLDCLGNIDGDLKVITELP